jgi:GATA-binding protein
MATRYAMLVVSSLPILGLCGLQLTYQGLYFKLHGRHRPIGMKKGEIKRRKRVIPASVQHHYAATGQQPLNDSRPAPMEPRHTPHGMTSLPHHNRGPAPPPVDFTSYTGDTSNRQLPSLEFVLDQVEGRNKSPTSEARNSRKRTHSEAEHESSRTNGAASSPSSTGAVADMAIDPSLSAGSEDKERRKALIALEKQRLRERMMALDEELKQMDDAQ